MPRILTNVLRQTPKPWDAPTFSMPLVITQEGLTPLGTDAAGFEWFSDRKLGELRAAKKLVPESFEVPNAPVVEVRKDGERWWQVFSVHAPGSYAQALELRTLAKPKPAIRVIDALASFSLLASTPGRNGTTHPPVRGAAAIVKRFESRDITLMLDASGSRVVFLSPKGRDAHGLAQYTDALTQLLVPWLHGGLPYCGVSRHGDDLVEAVTVAVGNVPWCGKCVPS